MIALARAYTERLLALVEKLLDLAQSDSGKLEMRAQPLDLARCPPGARPVSAPESLFDDRTTVRVPLTARGSLSERDRAFLERARRAIEEGFVDEEFHVEHLASRLAMDRTHLFRRLKRISGWTPSKLILETRLCRAAELIAAGEGKVGEIAVAVGFKSVSHFSERFRRRFGILPSACLRRHLRRSA